MAKKVTAEQEVINLIIITSKTKCHLKYVFTERDMLDLAQDMARAISEQHEAEDELKTISTQIKGKVALAVGAANSAASKIRAGYEFRNIECEISKDFTEGMVTTRRIDTGEIVDTRPIAAEERQAELPLADKPGA